MAFTHDELRSLFLFEALTDAQLEWLCAHASRATFDEGATVLRQGDPADALFILLEGGLRMERAVNGEQMSINETTYRGAYAGATRAYVETDETYANTIVATVPSAFLRLPAEDFRSFMQAHFPMAIHLLDGLYNGLRSTEGAMWQREHLARLGQLSATLAHELNNPAAGAVRATGQLRDRVAGMRHKLAIIAEGGVAQDTIGSLVELQERAVEAAAKGRARSRSPIEESDLEDAFVDRLDELSVTGGFDLAPVFAGASLDVGWLDEVVLKVGDGPLEGPLRWLAYTLETEGLMDEIEDATSRISMLVASVKSYSYVDSGSVQDVDVHVGLDSTVVMMGGKLSSTKVVRDYAQDLPKVAAHAAELNQVWTNLLANAADATGGTGTLTLRTRAEDDELVVEVADDGPGIPAEVQPRVFEPLFTTKPAGQGSGLGLDSARRIVERRHHGALSFSTSADGTCFQVRLPLRQRLS